MALVDPSDFTRPVGHTFLYSESGAAAIRRTDTDRPPFVLADKLTDPNTGQPVTHPDDDPWTYRCGNAEAYANPIDWDRNIGVSADQQPYAITPGKHAADGRYTDHLVSDQRYTDRREHLLTSFGKCEVTGLRKHARSDRD